MSSSGRQPWDANDPYPEGYPWLCVHERVGECPDCRAEIAEARVAELERELADLREGRTCILPKTREHALNMLTVAEALVHGRPNVEPLP